MTPLSIDIHTDIGIYSPGQVLRGLIRVSNGLHLKGDKDAPLKAVRILSLTATCHGLEQVDPGWVSSNYFADTPHSTKDIRRVIRYIFKTEEAEIVEELDVFPGQNRRYAVGFRLPANLPPTFKGTCVKYTYELQAVAKYQIMPFGHSSVNTTDVASKKTMELEVKKPIQVRVFADGDQGHMHSGSGLPSSPTGFISQNPMNSDGIPLLKVDFESGARDTLQLQWGEIEQEEPQMHRSESSSRLLSVNLDQFTPRGLEESASVPDSDANLSRGMATDRSTTESEFSMPGVGPIHRRTASDVSNRGSGKVLVSSISHKTYNLQLGDERLVRFSFNPGLAQELHPGATFGGILDFQKDYSPSEGHVTNKRCLAVNIMLETEEEIDQAWLPSSFKSRDGCTIRRIYCEQVEVTSDVIMTNFVFSIPPTAPPSFRTPLLTLRWVLRFEFVAGIAGQVASSGDVQKANAHCERFEWKLPVMVRAA